MRVLMGVLMHVLFINKIHWNNISKQPKNAIKTTKTKRIPPQKHQNKMLI